MNAGEARRTRHTLDVIVNVDDIGLHPAVRRAVEDCAARGTVTSASVLANGPDTDALRPYPGVSLGAHLNILRGRPLSPVGEVRSLVGADGHFLGSFAALAARAVLRRLDPGEVRLEWSRQVAHLRERGLDLVHLDGEKHTHCLPGLFAIACDVAREHAIPWVRRSDERFGNLRFGAPALRRAVLRALCAGAQTGPAVRTTDAVWGIAEQGGSFTAEACARALKGIASARAPRTIEVVCHPGRPMPGDPALPASFGRMRVHQLWEPEYRSLMEGPTNAGSWTETAAASGWRLVSFERP